MRTLHCAATVFHLRNISDKSDLATSLSSKSNKNILTVFEPLARYRARVFKKVITIETETYISADSIPELAFAREQERLVSEALMAARAVQADHAEYAQQPVDALSTGHRVLEAKQKFGLGSSEHQEANQALWMDCRRLVAEWRRKNKPESFAPITHARDEDSQEFIAYGRSTRAMNQDALIPTAYGEEDSRRINEDIEDFTSMHARHLGGFSLGQTVRMRTISECTDWSIEAYKIDGKSRGGYVPEIEKLMIRDMDLSDPDQRTQEQFGLPGTYFTHYVIQQALLRKGFDATEMDKTELHGTQLFVDDELSEFVAALDEVASEEWCTEIYLGEEVPKGTTKDYEAFKQEALERQELLESDAVMIADFVLGLCEENANPKVALLYVEEFVKQLLITKSQEDLNITTEMFDDETLQGLLDVQYLQQMGLLENAQERLNEVVAEAPGGGFCGAGSCDLERAKLSGDEADKIKDLGFDPKDTLVDKGNRRCTCGKKTVVYDLKQKSKGCLSCGKKKKY